MGVIILPEWYNLKKGGHNRRTYLEIEALNWHMLWSVPMLSIGQQIIQPKILVIQWRIPLKCMELKMPL